MRLIIYGDFNCPYSYLASQRASALRRLGHRVDWYAVEHDPRLPVTGTPGAVDAARWKAELAEVAGLALPGEHAPTAMPDLISNTYAATSAYAESLTDGIAERLRRDLFRAIWVRGAHLSSAYDVRPLIAALTNPPVDVRARLGLEHPFPGFGNADPAQPTRMLGGTIAPNGAPLTTTGWRRVTGWRREWLALGCPVVPAALDAAGTARFGVDALIWLAGLLPAQIDRQPRQTRTEASRPTQRHRLVESATVVGAGR